MDRNVILDVKNLSTTFHTERGDYQAISGVSFQIRKGEIVGIVGESGCGKSVTSQSILRLYDEHREARHSGEVLFENDDLLKLSQKEMERRRGSDIAMIFQDALSTLNPVLTIGYQLREPMRIHNKGMSKKEATEKAIHLLRLVGIPEPEQRIRQYPHELSGGMRQRVMIAISLACQPRLLIADEPTTALDVTIQAQIMDLILELNQQLQMGVMLITHDLAVVAETCTRAIVMYLGQVVEEAETQELFQNTLHPYTKALLSAVPTIEKQTKKREILQGELPSPIHAPSGCVFRTRCPYATAACAEALPEWKEIAPGHKVACHLYD